MYICILCCATNLFNGVNQLVNVTKVTPKKLPVNARVRFSKEDNQLTPSNDLLNHKTRFWQFNNLHGVFTKC